MLVAPLLVPPRVACTLSALRTTKARTHLITSHRHYATKALQGDAPAPPVPELRSWPHPIYSSDAITVHKSGFQAHATALGPLAKATSDAGGMNALLETLFDRLVALYPRTKRATHCMYAWRAHHSGSADGGESGAGERLERLLELGGCTDVVVVVYRWYGGVQLGSERWKCISGVAKEALKAGGFMGGEKQAEAGERSASSGSGKKSSKKKR